MLFLDWFDLDCARLNEFFGSLAHRGVVAFEEFKLVEELGLHDVHAVIAVHELHDGAIIVPHSHIIADHQRLELLDQAAL